MFTKIYHDHVILEFEQCLRMDCRDGTINSSLFTRPFLVFPNCSATLLLLHMVRCADGARQAALAGSPAGFLMTCAAALQ